MEERIIRTLDFNLRSVPSVAFLERFFRAFGIDNVSKDSNSKEIFKLAHMYLRFIQLDSQFLEFKPSQQAAVSVILAFNISQSPVATKIGLKKIPELQMRGLVHHSLSLKSVNVSVPEETQAT